LRRGWTATYHGGVSYDLYLFRPAAGIDPLEQVRELVEEEPEPGEPSAEAEGRKAALVEALRGITPSLERFVFDYELIAREDGITVEEAKKAFRHVELNGADDDGVQIVVHDEWATIHLPFWSRGCAADEAFERIAAYIGAARQQGYACFDPQLDQLVSEIEHIEKCRAHYEAVAEQVQDG